MQYSPEETTDYLAAASVEMAKLAEGSGLDALAYIFNMAAIEAQALRDSRRQERRAA